MSSTDSLLPIALNAMFQRQSQQRAMTNQAAINLLNSFISGLQTAKTPSDVKKTVSLFDKSIQKMTKGMPGGPLQLVNENDLANIERMVSERGEATLAIEQLVGKQMAGLLGGRITVDEAMNGFNKGLADLSKQYGAAEIAPLAAGQTQAILQAFQVQRSYESAQMNLKTALAPNVSKALEFIPQAAPLIINTQANLHANARAQVLKDWNIQSDTDMMVKLVTRGNEEMRTGKSVDQLGPKDNLRALEIGRRLLETEVAQTEKEMQQKFWDETLPAVLRVGTAQATQAIELMTGNYNRFFDEAGRLTPLAMNSLGLEQVVAEAREKFFTGQPTTQDQLDVTQVVSYWRRMGTLGERFQNMPEEEWETAVQDGTVDDAMKRITGPGGTSLWDLVMFPDGTVKPWAGRAMEVSPEKLAQGDPATWATANWWTTSSDFADFEGAGGMGPVETMTRAVAQAPPQEETAGQVIGEDFRSLGSFWPDLNIKARLFEVFYPGMHGVTEKDGRFFVDRPPGVAASLLPQMLELTPEQLEDRRRNQRIIEGLEADNPDEPLKDEDAIIAQAMELDRLLEEGDSDQIRQHLRAQLGDISFSTGDQLPDLVGSLVTRVSTDLEKGLTMNERVAKLRDNASQELVGSIVNPQDEAAQEGTEAAGPLAGRQPQQPTPPTIAPAPLQTQERIAAIREIGTTQTRISPGVAVTTPGDPAGGGTR